MYDIVKQILGHDWITNTTGDQQIIYYISGALILLFTVVMIDFVYRCIFWISHRK